MNIRIILADDHPAIILGVRHALRDAANISVVAEAGDPEALMNVLETTPCDVLVTDFSMPTRNAPDGIVMLRAIRSRFPHVRVVVLTMLENQALLSSMFDNGALAVLNKRSDLAMLPEAILTAWKGNMLPFSLDVEDTDSDADPEELHELARDLSARELEVVRLFVGGMTVTEIALHLHRSIKTISTQKVNAMKKLGTHNDVELVEFSLKCGLAL